MRAEDPEKRRNYDFYGKTVTGWSVKWKLLCLIMALMAALVSILTYTHISYQRKHLELELNKRVALLKECLEKIGKNNIFNLTRQVEKDTDESHFSGVVEAVRGIATENRDVKYAVLTDSAGTVVVHTLKPELIHTKLESRRNLEALSQGRLSITEYREQDGPVLEVSNPIRSGHETWGVLRLIYTLKDIEREIEFSKKEIETETNRMIRKSVITSLGFMAGCIIVLVILSSRFLSPLIQLTHLARKLSRGDFSVSLDFRVGRDEIGVLAAAFMKMSRDLKKSYKRLEDYSKILEIKVIERTKELDSKNIELKTAMREVMEAKMVAESASRAKGEFLANMSHEIRTPLNAILGMINLALKWEVPAGLQRYLNNIRVSADSLLGLINDILDFSKIEAGKMDIEIVDFDLNEVMENLCDIFSSRAAEKEIEIVVSIENEVPTALAGDPMRLGQVLINLVNNAVKFTENGEIVANVELAGSEPDSAELKFSVRDTGSGISGDKISAMFSPFTQADNSTSRKFGGTGLGLTISRQIVEMLGGSINVQSVPGVGSVFGFTLKFGRQKDRPSVSMIPFEPNGLKVILIEENAETRNFLESFLSFLSFKVTCAESVVEALREIARENFDLAIISWKMQGFNGIEIAERIKETLPVRLPVIMMTDFGNDDVASQARNAGVEAFIVKPIKRSRLYNIIAKIFKFEPLAAREEASATVPEQIRGARVLVVEDNPINMEVAMEILRDADMLVDVAENGMEAIEAVFKSQYDAVLMDIHMPEMDGYEATNIIRNWECGASGKRPRLPIIAMTAQAMKGDREKCLEAGMDEYLTKPIDNNRLLSILAGFVTPGKSERQKSPAGSKRNDSGIDLPDFLPGVDIKSCVKRLKGNKAMTIKLFRVFTDKYFDAADRIGTELARGDRDSVRQIVHAIKGAAGNLSANDLFVTASELELAIRTDCMDEIDWLQQRFETALNEFLTSAQKLLNSVDKSGK